MYVGTIQIPLARTGALNTCKVCHTFGSELNAYGADFASHGHNAAALEWLDSDKDGYSNNAEINAASFP